MVAGIHNMLVGEKDRFFCDKSDFTILQELCISFKA